jgi:hypothetical protein
MTDPTPAVPAAPSGEVAPVVPVERKGRGLGVFALILGLLGMIADIIVIILGLAQLPALMNGDWGSLLAGLAGVAVLGFIVFWGGIIVGALAVLLGIIAAVRNRGRVAGVFGIILGVLVAGSHILLGLAILGGGSALGGIGS